MGVGGFVAFWAGGGRVGGGGGVDGDGDEDVDIVGIVDNGMCCVDAVDIVCYVDNVCCVMLMLLILLY